MKRNFILLGGIALALWGFKTMAQVVIKGQATVHGSAAVRMGTIQTSGAPPTTPTQAVVNYTAPDTTTHCTIRASLNSSLSPLVDDINPAIFSGSNDDIDRYPALQSGISRVFVVGSLPRQGVVFSNLGSDGLYHSRALQENSQYYYSLTCGTSTVAQGTFTTNITPFGRTYPYNEPIAAPGQYGWPTLSATDRTQSFPDPDTGVLIKRLDLINDQTGVTPGGYAIGNQFACGTHTVTDDLGASWYLCVVPMNGGNRGNLYSVNAATGQSAFLGLMAIPATSGLLVNSSNGYINIDNSANFDASDSTTYYTRGISTSNHLLLISCQLPASGSSYYRLGVSQNSVTNFSRGCTILTPEPNYLLTQLNAFDSTFNTAVFTGLGIDAVQGDYIIGRARAGQQNSVAWEWAFQISTKSIIGMFPIWERNPTRWSDQHNVEVLDNTYPGWAVIVGHQLNVSGLYQGIYQTTLQTAMNATDATDVISVSTTTPVSSYDGSTLQAMQVGDILSSANEREVMLITNISGTNVTVTRGYAGSTKSSHSVGELFHMYFNSCGLNPSTDGGYGNSMPIFWNFVNDPHALDTTGTNLIVSRDKLSGAHESMDLNYRISSTAWGICNQTITHQPGCLDGTGRYNIAIGVPFAGISPQIGGADYQSHATSAHQLDAQSNVQVWGMDTIPFYSGGVSGGALNVSWTNVTGALYKVMLGSTNHYHPKILPAVAMAGYKPLVDVSGPSSAIDGTSSSNYKYCYAYKASECVSGSSAGDIYVNSPSIAKTSCQPATGLSWPNDESDICFGDKAPYANESVQIDMRTASTTGSVVRPLTENLTPFRMQSIGATAEQIPNGQWAMVYRWGADTKNEVLVKMPSFTQDGEARSDFIRTTIPLTAPGGLGVASAEIEFGYDANFYCTSRQEICVAVGSWTAGSTNPFWYETADSGSYSATACPASCSIDVPVIPDRIVYYRTKYFNSGGGLVSTSPTQVAAVY